LGYSGLPLLLLFGLTSPLPVLGTD
jgi:hypothetical protein